MGSVLADPRIELRHWFAEVADPKASIFLRWNGCNLRPPETGRRLAHPARSLDSKSVYSDMWYTLSCADWFYCDLSLAAAVDDDSADWTLCDEDAERTLYHGTTFWALCAICKAGAFIPGPNGHSKCGKHYKGAFGSTSFGEASRRADPTRVRIGFRLHMSSLPVVLEMRATNLVRYHKNRHDVFVCPGKEGSRHPGVRIARAHFNWRLVTQFHDLGSPLKIQIMDAYGFECQCGQGNPSFQCCGKLSVSPWADGWQRSKKGYYYCPDCIHLAVGTSYPMHL